MDSFHYLLCRRIGRKWQAIAGTNSGGCLAASETVFAYHALTEPGAEVHWHTVETQKNYVGRSLRFRAVELSETEQNRFWHVQAIRQGHYKSVAHFLETFPDAAQWRGELESAFTSRPPSRWEMAEKGA